MEDKNVEIYVILGAIILVLFIAMYILVKNKVHLPINKNNETNKSVNEREIAKVDNKRNEILSKIPNPISPILLTPVIKHLASSIIGLWQISNNEDDINIAEQLFDNLELIFNSFESDELKMQWNAFVKDRNKWDEGLYKEKSASMLELLKGIGIVIPRQEYVIWDEQTKKKYRRYGKIEEGNKCIVLSPYILYNGQIIEQGLVKSLT